MSGLQHSESGEAVPYLTVRLHKPLPACCPCGRYAEARIAAAIIAARWSGGVMKTYSPEVCPIKAD